MSKAKKEITIIEEKEKTGLTKKEILAKEHLESTSDITMNMGYVKIKNKELNDKNEQTPEIKIERDKQLKITKEKNKKI